MAGCCGSAPSGTGLYEEARRLKKVCMESGGAAADPRHLAQMSEPSAAPVVDGFSQESSEGCMCMHPAGRFQAVMTLTMKEAAGTSFGVLLCLHEQHRTAAFSRLPRFVTVAS